MSDKNTPLEKIVFEGDGTITRAPYTQEDLENAVKYKLREMAQNGELNSGDAPSPASVWLAHYRAKYSKHIFPLQFADENGDTQEFFVKQLSDSDVVEVGVLMSREGYTMRDMEDLEATHAYSTALLTVGVCRGENDPSRYFDSMIEAREFYESPGVAAQISVGLRAAIIEISPAFHKKKEVPAQTSPSPTAAPSPPPPPRRVWFPRVWTWLRGQAIGRP